MAFHLLISICGRLMMYGVYRRLRATRIIAGGLRETFLCNVYYLARCFESYTLTSWCLYSRTSWLEKVVTLTKNSLSGRIYIMSLANMHACRFEILPCCWISSKLATFEETKIGASQCEFRQIPLATLLLITTASHAVCTFSIGFPCISEFPFLISPS